MDAKNVNVNRKEEQKNRKDEISFGIAERLMRLT